MTSEKYFDAFSLVVIRGHSCVLLDTIVSRGLLRDTYLWHSKTKLCKFHEVYVRGGCGRSMRSNDNQY